MTSTENISLTTELQQLLTPEQAWHYRILPKEKKPDEFHLYIDVKNNDELFLEELELIFGLRVVLTSLDSDKIQSCLSKYYRKSLENDTVKKINLKANEEDDFLAHLILEAKQLNSSDIHIEIYEKRCRVRIRIDGHLVERYVLEKTEYPSLVNKIKIKSRLDIAEKRLPQDGRIFFRSATQKFDIRVSVLPTLHGEKVVMRLLNNDATNIDINLLGLSETEIKNYTEGIRKPNGIILISGPTGSGKTTTLYATLKLLNLEKRNIVTVEDPIEYTLEGINQVQVKEDIGLTFSNTLRSFLRQDPDVIMLGEIRDGETANMAIRAALTGHLVLSTIHTNSAWGTISRLVDMGVPPFLLSSTMNTSVAQRLVRLLCNNCKSEAPFDKSLYPNAYMAPKDITSHYTPKGCEDCYYTGYKGRRALYEIIPIDSDFSEKIKNNDFSITTTLKEKRINTLAENAFKLFAEGSTSIDEIYPLLFSAE